MRSQILLMLCAVLGVSGNVALRIGMAGFSHAGSRWLVPAILSRLCTTPMLWLGLLAYFVSMLGWLIVLSAMPLSQAYPVFVSLSFLLLLTSSSLLLGEPVRLPQAAGAMLIVAGIWLCTRLR